MEHKRLEFTPEQTLRLEQLRQVLAQVVPQDYEAETHPTPRFATCGGTCLYACDGTCFPVCNGTCFPGCSGWCWITM